MARSLKRSLAVSMLGAALGVAGLLVHELYTNKANASPIAAPEFVCYDDGKLTERHVGIRDAYFLHRQQGAWKLRYVDQEGSHYFRQAVGETCGVER